MRRKEKLEAGEIYHIFNKSIAEFKIFNNEGDFLRSKEMLKYYQVDGIRTSFSQFVILEEVKKNGFKNCFKSASQRKEEIVQIIAYCIMPTHVHLILKQLKENGISSFMGNILNSYTRYFNVRHKRKGPLWEGRFQNVLVKTDEQLLHLTRYIHLNPVTAFLVDKPEQWPWSSYDEYLSKIDDEDRLCDYEGILDVKPSSYKEFVEERIAYQRDLAKIKDLLLENTDTTPEVMFR
jgi:putative transposase